ncbi:hypothetical protein MUN78_06950 [Leucobacter allii]|uniref:DUF7426 domain-containing protein n=1 Tax=Leucobacter allii TaxID=2932247 RepID=A0ABY4FQV4_9MICO|nr:hypothetical protein [Leucobacter allii]UOQ58554.1 hypothetical protein MUN78_06950 [Leucobacter allii]
MGGASAGPDARGRTYKVQPPSVEAAAQVLAAAVRGEVNLGIHEGPIPEEVESILRTIKPGTHPALGSVYDELIADGVHEVTVDRMAYYAVFYWARGKPYADKIATVLWTPRELAEAEEGGESAPKGS